MPVELLGLAAAILGFVGVVARVFFYFKGVGDEKQRVESELNKDAIEEVARKNKRRPFLLKPSVLRRLRSIYNPKPKD